MNFLSLAIWLPIAAGVVLLAIGSDKNAPLVRWLSLAAAVAAFAVTIPLITRRSAVEENLITTGISTYPVGTGAPYHSHNCDEHVTLLEGLAEVEIEGVGTVLTISAAAASSTPAETSGCLMAASSHWNEISSGSSISPAAAGVGRPVK